MTNPKLQTGLAGEFKIEAINAETGERRLLADWFPNKITNGGLDQIGLAGGGYFITHVQVGTGSTAPEFTDSSLVGYLAGTDRNKTINVSYGVSPNYESIGSISWQFAQGAAAGNLSEIGVGWAASGSLFSRALILDINGDPTTITVQAIEFLSVTYRLVVYPPLTDVTGTINISGVDYAYILRAAGLGAGYWQYIVHKGWGSGLYTGVAYTGDLGAITGQPGGSTQSFPVSVSSYSSGSYKRTLTQGMSVDQGNLVGGIRSLIIYLGTENGGSAMQYQCQFTPTIPKDNTKTLSLTFDISWARRP